MKEKLLLFILQTIAFLPLKILYLLSDMIYPMVFYVVKYRRKIVEYNLRTSFPEKNDYEILKIEKEFYHFLCDQIVETLKTFRLSDNELNKRVKVFNADIVNNSLSQGKCAVLLLAHYGNWEWVQEITKYFIGDCIKASIYHRQSSELWNDVFLKLRQRWGTTLIQQYKAARFLLNHDNFPWVCGFIADHRPRARYCGNTVVFLNHITEFIYGPEQIGEKIGADFFYLKMERVKRGFYNITFEKLLPKSNYKNYPFTRAYFESLEKTIQENPAYWLWSHKRWKYKRETL